LTNPNNPPTPEAPEVPEAQETPETPETSPQARCCEAATGSAAKTPDNGVLNLCGVSFSYEPAHPVVRGVTATLKAGRVAAVIGPNAAGKTTLVKLMLGELSPQHGEVRLGGHSVAVMGPTTRACQMAYIPQHGGVQFAFTVRQIVEMGRFACGDTAGTREAIAQCDLAQVADRPFAQLSGGQQQRVLVARAIAQLHGDGKILLADEPASNMDLQHQLHLMQMLRNLASKGVAVLIVLHDLNLAARYADDVWLMHGGELVAAGPWSDVIRPSLLEQVYDVKLTVVARTQDDRPVLVMDEAGIMQMPKQGATGTES